MYMCMGLCMCLWGCECRDVTPTCVCAACCASECESLAFVVCPAGLCVVIALSVRDLRGRMAYTVGNDAVKAAITAYAQSNAHLWPYRVVGVIPGVTTKAKAGKDKKKSKKSKKKGKDGDGGALAAAAAGGGDAGSDNSVDEVRVPLVFALVTPSRLHLSSAPLVSISRHYLYLHVCLLLLSPPLSARHGMRFCVDLCVCVCSPPDVYTWNCL